MGPNYLNSAQGTEELLVKQSWPPVSLCATTSSLLIPLPHSYPALCTHSARILWLGMVSTCCTCALLFCIFFFSLWWPSPLSSLTVLGLSTLIKPYVSYLWVVLFSLLKEGTWLRFGATLHFLCFHWVFCHSLPSPLIFSFYFLSLFSLFLCTPSHVSLEHDHIIQWWGVMPTVLCWCPYGLDWNPLSWFSWYYFDLMIYNPCGDCAFMHFNYYTWCN